MEDEIIHKVKVIRGRIGKMIKSVESNESSEDIIVQINRAQKMLRAVRYLMLKDYLTKIAKRTGLSKKEILKYYNLIN